MRTLRLGLTGTDVMEIQALLKKIGFNVGNIDGIFGLKTHAAIMQFQYAYGLKQDGIIGPETHRALNRYLLGYDIYTVQAGDTFSSIAQRYFTMPAYIAAANPGIDENNLIAGSQIIVPYGIDVVDTNIDYTYDVLERDINGLKARYPFMEFGSIGESVLGRNLYYIRLGTGPNEYFYNAAHHALEWITSPLLMKFAEDFLKAFVGGYNIDGYNIADIWNMSSIYIVPMVNPDGIDLVLNGIKPDNQYYDDLIRWNNGSTDFSRVWQANVRGVDLNHNYDAAWELSRDAEESYGIFGPGPTRYSGSAPESEPETRAVADFTREHDFKLVMAYHSQGEVIYWTFMDIKPPQSREIAESLSNISGYAVSEPEGIASYAGYKDWFIKEYNRPGFTIEVGLGENPLPISQFSDIYSKNLGMLLYTSTV